jgi:hypothetical protein
MLQKPVNKSNINLEHGKLGTKFYRSTNYSHEIVHIILFLTFLQAVTFPCDAL